MNKIKERCIEKFKETYSWMEYVTFANKEYKNNRKYILIKFMDKIMAKVILWIYINEDETINIEFRNAQTTKIEHEFKYKNYDVLLENIESIKYLY